MLRTEKVGRKMGKKEDKVEGKRGLVSRKGIQKNSGGEGRGQHTSYHI